MSETLDEVAERLRKLAKSEDAKAAELGGPMFKPSMADHCHTRAVMYSVGAVIIAALADHARIIADLTKEPKP